MAPYYTRAEAICGLDPGSFDTAGRSEESVRVGNMGSRRVRPIIVKYGDRNAFRDTRAAMESRGNLTLLLHTPLLRFEGAGLDSGVARAEAGCADGRTFNLRARCFVIACGAIENARVLLLSRHAGLPSLTVGGGAIGAFFMEHPAIVAGVLQAPLPGDMPTFFRRHLSGGTPILGALGVSGDALRSEGLLNVAFYLRERPAALMTAGGRTLARVFFDLATRRRPHIRGREIVRAARSLPALALAALRPPRLGRGPPTVAVSAVMEQRPDRRSRVTLGAHRDVFGLPVARLEWRVDDADLDSARKALAILNADLEASGLAGVTPLLDVESRPVLWPSYHHLGTTRMSRGPDQGVVDKNCQVHGMNNLYICGGSVFPSGGLANPTLTIVALALRLADHLRLRINRMPVLMPGAPG